MVWFKKALRVSPGSDLVCNKVKRIKPAAYNSLEGFFQENGTSRFTPHDLHVHTRLVMSAPGTLLRPGQMYPASGGEQLRKTCVDRQTNRTTGGNAT